MKKKLAIVIGASSDIGNALCEDFILKKWNVYGTFRTETKQTVKLKAKIQKLIKCDLSNNKNVDNACNKLIETKNKWDVLIFGPGLQEPVELFNECNFDEFETSIKINFTNQLRILHRLLKNSNHKNEFSPTVLFFAGGGVNSAPINYTAYTVSKIALIKMVELLAAELPEIKFVIVGPGWVNTKIHNTILEAKEKAGNSYNLTLKKINEGSFTPISKVVECCNWLINGPRNILTGRNYSVVYDNWTDPKLLQILDKDKNKYKLRRNGN